MIIGSFNIKNFGDSALEKKNIPQIADIIESEGFDLLALQEIITPSALSQLQMTLGRSGWEV